MTELKIQSNKKNEMIDINMNIQKHIEKENIENGYVIAYVPHTTAGITINEGADPSVPQDIIKQLGKIVPETGAYSHMEGNSDAHIKASLLGSSVTVLIKNKKLVLGTWQHIFFYEGDGPRNRNVYLKIITCKQT
jgi:secondary thiamine-phosphate synthase enzyme